ncbi:MAG: hypothetical protein LBU46_06100, partial [Candidatus Accumulibacter sp.]|jgi:hypothetical protein|nr:hypothetical protein [Accumulibacter sp.]
VPNDDPLGPKQKPSPTVRKLVKQADRKDCLPDSDDDYLEMMLREHFSLMLKAQDKLVFTLDRLPNVAFACSGDFGAIPFSRLKKPFLKPAARQCLFPGETP